MTDSPGGVEEGRVSIRVVPDTSKFAPDLRADLAKIKIDFAIKVDLDNSGLDEKARLAADEAQAAAGKIDIKTNVDTSQLAVLDKGLASGASSAEGLVGSFSAMPVLIGAAVVAAAALSPALALVLPLLASIGLAVGAIALTFQGLKGVFAPLIDGVKSLTKPLTQTITQGLKPFVKSFTASFIPVLKTGLTASAQVLNQVAKAFLALGRDSGFMKDLQTFLVGAALAFRPLVNVIPLVAKAFVQIGIAAIPALLALTKGFAGILISFADGISRLAASGQLTTIIGNATKLLSAFGSIGLTVLKALLAFAIRVTPAMLAIYGAVQPLVAAFGTALLAAVNAVAPVFKAVFATLANNKPLLIGVAAAFGLLVAPLTTLGIGLVLLVANFGKVVPFLKTAFTAISTAVQPMIQAFSGVITSAKALATTLTPIVQQIVAVFVQNWPQIQLVIAQVFSTIQSIVVAVLTVISTQIKIITAVIAFVWARFGGIILATIQQVFPAILTTISGVLNVIQGIFRLFTDVLKGNWSGAWADIKQIVTGAIQAVQGTVRTGLALLKGIALTALTAAAGVFKTLGSAVVTAIGDIAGTFESIGADIISGIIRGITDSAHDIGTALEHAVSNAKAGVEHFFGIGSPSKVFADDVGRWLALGIAKGIDDSATAINSSMIKAVKPPSMTGVFDGVGSAGSGAAVHVDTINTVDPETAIKKLEQSQRDAQTVANLRLALVG